MLVHGGGQIDLVFHTQIGAPNWRSYPVSRAVDLWIGLHRQKLDKLQFESWWWEEVGDPDNYPDPDGVLQSIVDAGGAWNLFDAWDVMNTDVEAFKVGSGSERGRQLRADLAERRQVRRKRLDGRDQT